MICRNIRQHAGQPDQFTYRLSFAKHGFEALTAIRRNLLASGRRMVQCRCAIDPIRLRPAVPPRLPKQVARRSPCRVEQRWPYLHGFLIRDPHDVGFIQHYHYVFADGPDEEGAAFGEAMRFLTADPAARIYYYSKYERSSFRALADRHPGIASRDEIERLFHPTRATDLLFDVIMPNTEWPTSNLSIKTLARSLGFTWRHVDASGAASIAWFDEYVRTREPSVKHRILSYNEDDVRASAVVLDGLRALPVSGPPIWPPNGTEPSVA